MTSCAGTQDAAAASAAERLLLAVADQDGDTACSLLAPAARTELEQSSGGPCAESILEEGLGKDSAPLRVDVYDTMAQVHFASDTVFLSRFDGQWLIIAAACTRRSGRPYDCSVQVS